MSTAARKVASCKFASTTMIGAAEMSTAKSRIQDACSFASCSSCIIVAAVFFYISDGMKAYHQWRRPSQLPRIGSCSIRISRVGVADDLILQRGKDNVMAVESHVEDADVSHCGLHLPSASKHNGNRRGACSATPADPSIRNSEAADAIRGHHHHHSIANISRSVRATMHHARHC